MERARAAGMSWSQIAAALGLRSRQAAEQRYLRRTGRDPDRARRRRLARTRGPSR